jgi:hypothetical protein
MNYSRRAGEAAGECRGEPGAVCLLTPRRGQDKGQRQSAQQSHCR